MKLKNDFSAMCCECTGGGCIRCGGSGLDFTDFRFHPSSLGDLMTDSRTKEPIGETCKTKLLSIFIEEKYGRSKEIKNKFIKKGLAVEEDSITLYSRALKRFHQKNEEHIHNDYFIGTPDLFDGPEIMNAKTIIDIKSSWDIHTFFSTLVKPLNKAYYWQLQAYMSMTGATEAKLVYCLVNTPESIINDEKRKLAWQMGVATDENPLAQEAFAALEKEMIFDDIPLKDRFIEMTINRDDEAILKAKARVWLCREFLNEMARSKSKESVLV